MPIDLTLTPAYVPQSQRTPYYSAPATPSYSAPVMPYYGYGGYGMPPTPNLMKMYAGMTAGRAGGEALGMLANELFGRDVGKIYGRGADEAMRQYRKYMEEAGRILGEHEAAGRGDITGGLERAQAYGEPYRGFGEEALGTYRGALGLGGSRAQQTARAAFQASPAYQFMLEEGLRATRRGMAPTGLRGSGAEQRALMRYGSGLAAQEYGAWQDRLAKAAGLGAELGEQAAGRELTAGEALGQLGYGYGTQLGGLQQSLGQASAEAELAKVQYAAQQEAARQKGISDILGSIGSAAMMIPFL